MPEHGKSVIMESGKRGIHESGKGAVFDEEGACATCCGCEPETLASATTNRNLPPWDLTPYQGDHMAPPRSYWRLIEMGSCYPGGYPWYNAGCVNGSGRLVGLPNQFTSGYYYNGYMELQIGCLDPEDQYYILWPGSCQTRTWVYSC